MLGRSHQKLKKLTKVIHKNAENSTTRNPHPKRLDDKHDKKKVKFGTPPAGKKDPGDGKQVNVVNAADNQSSDSESEESESVLPDETSVSSGEHERTKYFDLLTSSSEDYVNSSHSDDEE